MAQNLRTENVTQGINPLLQALQLEDRLARQKEIAEILEEFDEDKSVSLLFDALLKSPKSESRKTIVEELIEIPSARAIEILQAIMTGDFDPDVQREAVKALRQIGSDKAIDALLSVLRTGNQWSRREATRVLGEFNSDRVVDALIEASKDYLVADTAVFSLAQTGSDRATERLLTVMQDLIHGSATTSFYAISGLVRLGSEKAIDGLLQAWDSAVSIIADRLYFHLVQFKPKHLIIPLYQRLLDKTLAPNTRKAAAEMLGIIGTENEVPLLKAIWSEDVDKDVGWSALRAAERIALSELEKKAERERALEETRAFMAHEFRHCLTPLNAYVKMLGEALTQPQDDVEKLLSLTARIRQQTDAAIELVERYLDYSRPLAPHFTQIDISDLLQQSLSEFGADLEKRRIVLQSRLAPNSDAEVDRQMLAQVLRNVVANAIQAMDREGALTITSALGQEDVAVTVRDSGAGIKPEHLAHIFEIGFTTKSNVRGAGLGLALCKRIIEEAHHGTLVIANNTDGLGATVLITLPKKQMEIPNGRQHLALADR